MKAKSMEYRVPRPCQKVQVPNRITSFLSISFLLNAFAFQASSWDASKTPYLPRTDKCRLIGTLSPDPEVPSSVYLYNTDLLSNPLVCISPGTDMAPQA